MSKFFLYLNINYLIAKRKRKKLLNKFPSMNIEIGLYTSVNKTKLTDHIFLGRNVNVYGCEINEHSYVNSNSSLINVNIGRFCSIGSNVKAGLGLHPTNLVSSHPAFYSINKPYRTYADKEFFDEYIPINIGNDVWIGNGATIMGGLSIGHGAIIAAGAIVTKDVQPYSIVGGIPAKHIKFRIKEELIPQILKTEWWNKDEAWFEKNWEKFHNPDGFINSILTNECEK